jgi:hypothetical protein
MKALRVAVWVVALAILAASLWVISEAIVRSKTGSGVKRRK